MPRPGNEELELTNEQHTPTADDVRMAHQEALSQEIAVGGWRFQTLSIFLAAVGVIIGLNRGHVTRSVGALLLGLTAGVWIIDLRSRDLLRRYRGIGERIEASTTLPVEQGPFLGRGSVKEARLALLCFRDIKLGPPLSYLISFQFGIDVIILTTIGYAISRIVG